jgi:hypothetical protein
MGDSRQGRWSRKVIGRAKGRADRDAGTTQWRLVATPAAILLRSAASVGSPRIASSANLVLKSAP